MPVRRPHIAILLVFGARPALAVPSFQFSSDLGPLLTFLTAIVSISLVLYILFKLFSAASRRNQPRKQRATGAESRENFHYQATAHGCRALRKSVQDAHDLLPGRPIVH